MRATLAIVPGVLLSFCAIAEAKRPLSIDDVLAMSHIDQVAISPDRKQLAVVILRPAGPGETYGRTHYEVDPSRGDLWLIDRSTGATHQITDGREKAAGSWCAQWSPDGRHLAFLSTMPESGEPKGGDNVHLYAWNARSGNVRRVSGRAVMNQTRTGSQMWNVSFRGPGDDTPRQCRTDEDNAPFVWTDSGHILVALRPERVRSGLFEEYSRALSLPGETLSRIQQGKVPTVTRVGSGAERTTFSEEEAHATLSLIDVIRKQPRREVEVPAYPFWGELAVAVSPDARRLAVLATSGLDLQPHSNPVVAGYQRSIVRQLGFGDLSRSQPIRWSDEVVTKLQSWTTDSGAINVRLSGNQERLVSAATGTLIAGAISATVPSRDKEDSSLPGYAKLQAQTDDILIYSEPTEQGLLLREKVGASTRTLLTLDTYLADIDWGRREIIDYSGPDGQPLKAALLLPPDWQAGQRLPTLVWVYPGTRIMVEGDYFSDPTMPGFYNLRLYAARGFAVLIPSMPYDRAKKTGLLLPHLLDGVTPAVDALVARNIADPNRLGIFGQSLGGYTVNGILTQTDRFKAAAAIAGISDWRSYYLSMDPTGRGYAGVEHERSANIPIVEGGYGQLGKTPWGDPELYEANSPIAFVDRIQTPLLLIHGEQDVRGGLDQAETMFVALWRQGKTARLSRYWGESHGLALSPANVRSIHAELADWFARYLVQDFQR